MKKLITITVFLFAVFSYSLAQGNLQFNQVIDGNTALHDHTNTIQVIGTIVVPAGKVLKIETTNYTWTNGTSVYTATSAVYADNHVIWYGTGVGKLFLPTWLPEGTYTLTSRASSSTVQCMFSYTAIEFNVIP